MATTTAELIKHPFLHGLTEAQVESLKAQAQRFEPGAFLTREGEEARTLYLLVHGRVSLELHVPGRGVTQVETIGAGDIIGLSWNFPPYRWHLDARASEPVEAFAIDAPHLRGRIEDDPEIFRVLTIRLMHLMYERIERLRMHRLDVYGAGR
ncbi:MAG: cyclic nucleotide-binding domain-containing protein [Deltaproteobacteria bacterium]|nr:cyclic nucleotide-binding domain-containing protein [Deltaproteobacteria bacterium]